MRTGRRFSRWAVVAALVSVGIPAEGQAGRTPPEAKTGSYAASFTERNPLSALEELTRRLPRLKPSDYKLSDESYGVTVPGSYKAGVPHGLLVFINAGDSGDCEPNFKPLLEKHRLIWIGANKSGNERLTPARIGLALDAVHNMKKLYTIDPDRIYLSGTSGGGRVSSFLAPAFPDVFNGAMYLIGCNSLAAKLPPELQDRMRRLNGYVFLTGDADFNLPGTKRVFEEYQKDHFARTTYLQVPGMAHEIPPTPWLEKGIVFLDEPLVAGAKKLHAQGMALLKRDKAGQALKAFRRVSERALDATLAREASEQIAALEKKRDEQLAVALERIEAGKRAEAVPLLEKLIRDYDDASGNARELLKRARP